MEIVTIELCTHMTPTLFYLDIAMVSGQVMVKIER